MIKSIRSITSWIVETDEYYPTFRRNGPDNWEQLMGTSWEPVFNCALLEADFQAAEFLRKTVG